ncbi:MAG TPA: hypothetical protein DIS62_06830 [Candidatus Kerfeldbacteria bacterium]|nr:hypothetical protein [Candidatus Kerfeldbacteria bacterium]
MKILWTIVGILVVGTALYYLFFRTPGLVQQSPSPSPTVTLSPSPSPIVSASPTPAGTVIFDLDEQNNSNEDGKVTLIPLVGNKTQVVLNVENVPARVSQPAHIHVGECPSPGAVKYALTPVVNGTSTTTLNVTVAQLKAQGKLAVNVHKSANEISTYVACADLKL